MHIKRTTDQWIPEDQLFADHDYYLSVLLWIYETISDSTVDTSSYRSRYVRYRFSCPYSAYCTLVAYIPKVLHMEPQERFPSPKEVFGVECKCLTCFVRCERCSETKETHESFTESNRRGSSRGSNRIVVHHKRYDVVPNSSVDWHTSFGFLCYSCNLSKENYADRKKS